jgi:transposase
MNKKAFIGIDLHKDNFTACYIRRGKQSDLKLYELSNEGLNDFRKSVSRKDEIAIESVSNAYFFCTELEHFVKKIVVVSSSNFQIINKSIKKTDKHDAEALAYYLSKNMLPKARVKSKIYYDLASLTHTREQLSGAKLRLINRAYFIAGRHGKRIEKRRLGYKTSFNRYIYCHDWDPITLSEFQIIEAQLKSLNESIFQLEEQINHYAKGLKGYDNLLSITGIAPLSAAILLSVIGDIRDFEHAGRLASYFGIVPKVSQSNNKDKIRRITKKGSKIGRRTLIRCSMVARQHNDYLKDFHQRIKDRRGGGRAMIASARKYLEIIFNTLKNDWIFEDFPNYKYYIREDK